MDEVSIRVTTTEAEPASAHRRRLPGVEGIWVFVFADMTIFGILFVCFMVDRQATPAVFEEARRALDPNFGGVNTLILLTSSWLVVMAIDALRDTARARTAPVFFALAFACGLAFTASKVIEYTSKINAGISPVTNDFFMYYFVLTGMHLAHVLAGTIVLAVLWHKSRTAIPDGPHTMFESGATYWHMVDLLWIFLFPLLYLVR